MVQVSDGAIINLAACQAELEELPRRRSELVAALAALDERRETLERIVAFGRAEASVQPSDQSTSASEVTAPKAAVLRDNVGVRLTRDVIIDVLAALPCGTELSTSELHERMESSYGYTSSVDAVRRSAQRMAGRGELVKVAPALWRLAEPAGGREDC